VVGRGCFDGGGVEVLLHELFLGRASKWKQGA
jgi:hypothetical protein